MSALTFWHVAGDIIWRGDERPQPIEAEQVRGLMAIYRDEVKAAHLAGEHDLADRAQALLQQLHDANAGLGQWQRATSYRRAA